MAICSDCGNDFEPGHKGFANKCYDCSFTRKPTAKQQENWDNHFDLVTVDGELLHFKAVRHFTTAPFYE
jgi:hypothetical protein